MRFKVRRFDGRLLKSNRTLPIDHHNLGINHSLAHCTLLTPFSGRHREPREPSQISTYVIPAIAETCFRVLLINNIEHSRPLIRTSSTWAQSKNGWSFHVSPIRDYGGVGGREPNKSQISPDYVRCSRKWSMHAGLCSNMTTVQRFGHTVHKYFLVFEVFCHKLTFKPAPYSLQGDIDYRCEDGRFPVSTSSVIISNPGSLSSSDTGVDPGIRSWKKHSSGWARCQKAIGGIYFTKKWRAETLQPGLEFDNFKPRLESGIFKCIYWLNGSFLGVMIGVFWKRKSRPV